MDAWLILLPAFTLSVLLVFTHTYLGLHVLARGIIFVDLALAQVAALGASVAFLLGQDPHGLGAQLYALAATLAAAFGFAKLRRLPDKTTREVVIGCVYVVATALSIVVLSRSAAGMEELKALLNGSILWVRWQEIALVAVIYVALAGFHMGFWRHFRALSFE
jgi:zinc/manganese transport system permease protein